MNSENEPDAETTERGGHGAFWERRSGSPKQESLDYDAELQLHNELLRRAYRIGRNDRVLDIGCGTGESTRDAARAAVSGSAHGVDLAEWMIKRARELSEAQGIQNVSYEQADAQVHAFPRAAFDVGISRFGTMFFADPVAAFINIGRALRAEGRLVMMVWQGAERNEWAVSIRQSLAVDEEVSLPKGSPDPFSLADPATVEEILDSAGFAQVTFTEVHEPVFYGPNVSSALEFVRGMWSTNAMLEQMDSASASRAVDRLRKALAEHDDPQGVWFESRAWIVSARRSQ